MINILSNTFYENLFIINVIFNIILIIFYHYLLNEILIQILWVNLFLSLIFVLFQNLLNTFKKGNFDLFFINYIYFENLIFLKMLFSLIINFLPFCLLIPIFNIFIPGEINLINFILSGLYLNTLTFIFTFLIIKIKNNLILLYILIFPLFLPFIIFNHLNINFFFIVFLFFIILLFPPYFITFIFKENS